MQISTAIHIIQTVARVCYAIIYASFIIYDSTLYASLLLIAVLFLIVRKAAPMDRTNNSGYLLRSYLDYGTMPFETTQVVPVVAKPPQRPTGLLKRFFGGRSAIADKITLVPDPPHERQTDRLTVIADPPWSPTVERMPRDLAGRSYLSVKIPFADTYTLVYAYVAAYHQVAGCYPDCILLSRQRWIIYGEQRQTYSPFPGMRIPYACESGGYDIMVRGR